MRSQGPPHCYLLSGISNPLLDTSATHVVCEEVKAPGSKTQMPSTCTLLGSSDLQYYPLGAFIPLLQHATAQQIQPSGDWKGCSGSYHFIRPVQCRAQRNMVCREPHNHKVTSSCSAGLLLDKSQEFQWYQTWLHAKSVQYFCCPCALRNLCYSGFPIDRGTWVLCQGELCVVLHTQK